MTIPTTGRVTLQQVAAETGYSGSDAWGLVQSCDNTFSPVQVPQSLPFDCNDFRGYDHDYVPPTIDEGTLSVSPTNGTLLGSAGDYRWTADLVAKPYNVTGTLKILHKTLPSGPLIEKHSQSVTVNANTNKSVSGVIAVLEPASEVTIRWYLRFEGDDLDYKDLTISPGGGLPPL